MSKTAKVSVEVKEVKDLSVGKTDSPISKETRRSRGMIPQIEKSDGRLVPFDFDKIAAAVWKALAAAEEGDQDDANLITHQVAGELGRFAKKYKSFPPPG